jgi:DNA-binding MarR family transcriptional regulator
MPRSDAYKSIVARDGNLPSAEAKARTEQGEFDAQAYFRGVAEARYAIRKCFRIVDEEARSHGIEPLQHQALIQIYGAPEGHLTVSELATRLDVVPALASRLAKSLKDAGYVSRAESSSDRRLSFVQITHAGIQLLLGFMVEVEFKIALFQHQLKEEEKLSALTILGLYVGLPIDRDRVNEIVLTPQAGS